MTDDVKKVEKDRPADPCEDATKDEGNQSGKGMLYGVTKKKKLLETEASLIIQSAYPGFQVTKSQPLTKLEQISGFMKQVEELKKRIQDLEFFSTIHIDEKQKFILREPYAKARHYSGSASKI